ncbi:MAG TPA: HAD family hydrolase [Polyangiaceae bacterium]
MSVQAWLVDFDGTLYRALWVRLAMAAELGLTGLHVVRTLRHFREEQERIRAELRDEVPCPYRLQLERTAKALEQEQEHVERCVTEWMIERPGKWIRLFRRAALLEEIAAFKQQGGRTALVSDYPATRKLDALGHSALFDTVVASGELDGPRRLKPHPDGFLSAARRLGVSPEHCLVIGDREDADGLAATAAGMQFRWIR